MISRQIPTQYRKSILSTLPPYSLQVVSTRAPSLLGALATLIGGLTAPAAPIVLPIVASLFLEKMDSRCVRAIVSLPRYVMLKC